MEIYMAHAIFRFRTESYCENLIGTAAAVTYGIVCCTDSMGIWNRADESLIKKFTNKTVEEFFNDNNINAKDIGQLRDRLLAEFKSEDIYVQYCAWLKERFNTNMPAEEILKVRWDFANELLQKEVDYKEDADVLLKKLKQNGYTLALATTTPKARLDLYRKKIKEGKY